MVKSLSIATMVAWSQSPEQGCVKRLTVCHGGESLNVGKPKRRGCYSKECG